MTGCFDVTKYTLNLGSADTITGWCSKSFASDSTDQEMIILNKGEYRSFGAIGLTANYDKTGYSLEPYNPYDELTQTFEGVTRRFRVLSREPLAKGTDLIVYKYHLTELPVFYADQPSTSGTWNTTQYDARYKTKLWLDTYLSDAALTLDNNNTQADWITQWAYPEYNWERVFDTKGVELVFSIEYAGKTPLLDFQKRIYAYTETVKIHINAVDKSGLTALNLIDKAVQEIEKELNTYGYTAGSIRSLKTYTESSSNLSNGQRLYGAIVELTYKRANEAYTATYPTITWGSDYIYDGTHTSGGEEGTWTLTQGSGSTATQTSNTTNGLEINCTVYNEDSYTNNGTALSYSPAIYPYFKCRYKTTGSAKIKIILVDENNHEQTALSETSASTWTLSTVAIDFDDSDSLIGFKIYQCDGVGSVYVDFLQVYKGTYTFPNVIELTPPSATKDVIIPIPGMYGNVTQEMGAELVETEIVCDLDMEPSGLSWKRPQTTTKTDDNNIDCFTDINLGSSSWEWLNIGNPTYMFRVRLYRVEPNYNGDSSLVKLFFREFQPRALSWSVDDRLARSLRV
jgi:hypothetical protein